VERAAAVMGQGMEDREKKVWEGLGQKIVDIRHFSVDMGYGVKMEREG